MESREKRWSAVALLATGMAIGVVVVVGTPAGAHVSSWAHNWNKHIKPKTDARYYTKAQANARFPRSYRVDAPNALTTIVATNPATTDVRSITLPAGRYRVSANVLVNNLSTTLEGNPRCFLMRGADELAGWHQPIGPDSGTNIYRFVMRLEADVTLTTVRTVRAACSRQAGENFGALAEIFALRVSSTTDLAP